MGDSITLQDAQNSAIKTSAGIRAASIYVDHTLTIVRQSTRCALHEKGNRRKCVQANLVHKNVVDEVG